MDDINAIRLENTMIAALYGHSLVQEFLKEEDIGKVKFLGNNAKNITILVEDPEHSFLPENELAFLTKMLSACNLNIGDVAIVNMKKSSLPFREVINELLPRRLIGFGGLPADFIEKNKNIDVIVSAPVKDMMTDSAEAKQLKSRLWAGLKEMFGL